MLHVRTNRAIRTRLSRKIAQFYINIWYDRLINVTRYKYAYTRALRNGLNVLTFFSQTFNDNYLKNPTLKTWQDKGWKEIQYKNWHFAVVVQLDLFGNNTAIVQDCIHDKDYHNDNMQTKPFVMDNPNDQSHLADWKEYRMRTIIRETINQYIRRSIIR